jgi:hypothetical protein
MAEKEVIQDPSAGKEVAHDPYHNEKVAISPADSDGADGGPGARRKSVVGNNIVYNPLQVSFLNLLSACNYLIARTNCAFRSIPSPRQPSALS